VSPGLQVVMCVQALFYIVRGTHIERPVCAFEYVHMEHTKSIAEMRREAEIGTGTVIFTTQ
jgi:hypothetical protein